MTTQPSAPGPDFTGEIAAAMAAPGLAGVPNLQGANVPAGYVEYRVSPPGDATPTSGATLDEVIGAPDAVDEAPGAAPDAAVESAPNPVDVSTLGGNPDQWWVSPEDAATDQAMADAVDSGAPAPSTPYQPFPPGPDGMVAQ